MSLLITSRNVGLLSDFECGFVILQSLHLIIASASNRSGATRVVAIGVMKTFDMV